MIFELLLAAMAFAVLLAVVVPLMRPTQSALGRGAYDQAVYRDQLQELDRDIARGLLTETEAVGSRLEIQRRLLAAGAVADAPVSRRSGRSAITAALVVLFVGGGAVGLYVRIGAPEIPDTPYASRAVAAPQTASGGAADPEHPDLQQAVAQLAAKLKADPSNTDGWLLYARASGSLKRWDVAADAYRHAIALGANGADVQAGLGEMLTIQADGIVTPAAHDAFLAALKAEPTNDVAEYYMAIAAGQAGEPEEAIKRLQKLLSEIPEDSPMREEIGKRIGEAAKAANLPMPVLAQGTPAAPPPNAEDAQMEQVAALPPDQQQAMIKLMVSKLADRLKTEPGDVDGWMRLGRAYSVMGDTDKAGDAYDHALALKPNDVAMRLQVIDGLLGGLKPQDPLPPRAVALLKEVQTVEPQEPAVLWYLGVVAARDAHPDQAKEYWSQLLGKLPAGGEDAKMVKSAMDQLKGG